MAHVSKGARRVYHVAYRFRRRLLDTHRRVTVTLRTPDHQAFARQAQVYGFVSVPETIAALAMAQLQQKPLLSQEEKQLLRSVTGQLRRIGNNLNQAVRALHRHDVGPETEHLQHCLNYLHQQLKTIENQVTGSKSPS